MRRMLLSVAAAAALLAIGASNLPAQNEPPAAPATPSNPQEQKDQKPPAGTTPSAQTGSSQPITNPEPPADQSSSQPSTQRPTQQPGQQPAQKPQRPIRVQSNAVLVPVTVKNSTGEIIGDLRRSEFRLFEDGKEQQVQQFTTEPYPLSLVVCLDNDLSNKLRDQVQKSLSSIAGGIGPADEAALMLYDEFPQPVLEFTQNTDVILTKLQRLKLGGNFPSMGGGPMSAGPVINNQSQLPQVPVYGIEQEKVNKDMDDAVHAAGELLRSRGRDRRKIIFLISDGQNSHHNKWTFQQTRELLLSSDISVYTVTIGTILLKHEPGRMTRYATDTGGDSYFASKQNELERLYSNMTEEARNQYTLTYVPQGPKPGEYHSIEVRVERPGVHVNARQGYFVGPKP